MSFKHHAKDEAIEASGRDTKLTHRIIPTWKNGIFLMVAFLIPTQNDFNSHNQEPLLPCWLNNSKNIDKNTENV